MNRNVFLSTPVPGRFQFGILLAVLAMLLPGVAHSQDVVINEIMASNGSINPIPTNTTYFPDYVELYNRTGSDIDLNAGAWAISDKRQPRANDFKDFYRFPAGTVIPANGYLLVYFDDKTNNAGIHTTYWVNGTNVTFTLRAGGDWVHLVQGLSASSFTSVSSNEFGPQITDRSIGRVPDGEVNGQPWTLTKASPNGGGRTIVANTAESFVPAPSVSNALSLKINEWLAFNLTGSGKTNDDWFEIYNPDPTNIVSMGGMAFVDRGSLADPDDLWKPENQLPLMSFIAAQGFVSLIADSDDNDENNNPDDPDVLDFSLSSSGANGDFIAMYASTNQGSAVIDIVSWPSPLQTPALSRGRVPDGSTNIVVLQNSTQGDRNFGAITEIVISEVLTHTDSPLEDAIELQNVTGTNVNIGDWWLTNNPDQPKKFRIPTNTIVPPGGFVVFYEGRPHKSPAAPKATVGFNRSGLGNGTDFTLNSANGDQVYLFKGRADGSVTGDRRGISFGPAENGVSFGRYVTSVINGSEPDYVPMARSFGNDNPATATQFRLGTGKTNPAPMVGPIVISEIFYHPHIGAPDDEDYEFIEIRNISDSTVLLYDPAYPTNRWRIKDAVDFTFPAGQSLAPDEYALILNFNPVTNLVQLTNFTNAFPNIPPGTKLYGPYGGELNDSGARVELAWPDHPQAPGRPDAGLVPYIVMDRVQYKDSAPWNPNADGGGGSLQRRVESEYGNDPVNWKGEIPTPGRFNSALGTEPPRITRQPADQTVKELYNTTFSVGVRGGERSYQWIFNGENIPDGTNATLQLIGVSPEDAGSYQVLLSNTAGSVTSVVAVLTVTETPPDLTRPTVKITSPANNSRLTNPNITLQGTASDNTALARVEYRLNEGNYTEASGLTAWSAALVLEPGTNLITARAVDTSGNALQSSVHRLTYVVTSPLDLTVNGSGTVAGATDGQALEVGRSYTLTATPAAGSVFSNWTGDVSGVSPKLTFIMEEDLEVVANFVPNPFTGAAGKYNGLFYVSTGVEHASSGFFNLSVTDRGTYTAMITAGGKKLRATGAFDLEGRATNVIAVTGANSLTVIWSLHLDDSDRVSGTVSDGVWTADLAGDRAVFSTTNPYEDGGKFTLVIPGTPGDTSSPEGDSYGTVSIDTKGNINFKGSLADKTTATQKVPVSKNGEWPFFVSLYGGQGSILGWITNVTDGDFEGAVSWSKPALATSKYYPAGFSTNYTLIGSPYTAPLSTERVLNVTNAVVTFNGGNLAASVTNSVVLISGNKVTNATPANKLTFTFTLPTGLFKGTVTPAGTTKAIPFSGAVLQRSNTASGYFLGTNQSGRVLFEAAPAP